MDLMNGIALMSMQMKAQDFAQNYSISVMKKVLDLPELSAELLTDMTDAISAVSKGQYIDVYA